MAEQKAFRLRVSFKESFRMVSQYFKKRLVEQIKAVALIIAYLIIFQTAVLGIPLADSAMIAAGICLVVFGLTFFMEGLLLGLMPLGEVIGVKLPRKSKLPVILGFAFILGLGATFAEPAIGVLRAAGRSVAPWDAPLLYHMLNQYATVLVYSVGIGVGLAVIFGMLRFLHRWSLKPFIYILVGLLTALSLYAYLDPNLRHMLGLAWDCGAVTTGPVTVPLVLALGIGISRIASGGSEDGGGGFGVVTLASLFPIIAVLIIGSIVAPRVPEPQSAQEFFSAAGRDKAIVLFQDIDEMKAYALRHTEYAVQMEMFDNDPEAMHSYLGVLAGDEGLQRRLFGSIGAFISWSLQSATPDQRVALYGSAAEADTALEQFASQAILQDFDTADFIVRNSLGAVQAIVPLSLFLILVLLFVLREKLPQADEKILGIVFALVGMAIFSAGLEIGLSKIGDQVGTNLPASFTAVAQPHQTRVIPDFKPESALRSAISTDGTMSSFFYLFQNNEYIRVPFDQGSYDDISRQYTYLPKRGPLFGKGEWGFAGLFVAVLFAFIMGYGATLAEPALNALGRTVEEITVGTFRKSLLMQAVAVGVGCGIALGLAKIIWDLPLFWMLVVPYAVLLIMTKFSTEEFVNIAWDSAGVTTGPITVPLVLALGLGIGSQTGVVEGFGILSMASVCPILSVLTVGLMVNRRRTRMLKETMSDNDAAIAEGGKA